jgi:lysophospholipase L1-like esterase
VIVVSIPDWGVTAFGHASGRDRPKSATNWMFSMRSPGRGTIRAGALFVNITGISRTHPWFVAADGLHPSSAQYALWTDAIEPVVRAALH